MKHVLGNPVDTTVPTQQHDLDLADHVEKGSIYTLKSLDHELGI